MVMTGNNLPKTWPWIYIGNDLGNDLPKIQPWINMVMTGNNLPKT